MAKTKPLTKTEQAQLELGKKLQAFYEMGYVNKKDALKWSFLKGLAGGFGAFLGGTIVVALILWILSFFNHIPLIEPIVRSINDNLHK